MTTGRVRTAGKALEAVGLPPAPAGAVSVDSGRYELWFTRRLGPARRTVKKVGDWKIPTTRRKLEMPPNANDRLHWRVKGPWIAEWRKAGRDGARAQNVPAFARVRISAVIYRSRLGRADADGDLARLKPLVDGLVDAGVVPDDRRKFVEYGPVIEHRATCEPGILLILEPLAATDDDGREGT